MTFGQWRAGAPTWAPEPYDTSLWHEWQALRRAGSGISYMQFLRAKGAA